MQCPPQKSSSQSQPQNPSLQVIVAGHESATSSSHALVLRYALSPRNCERRLGGGATVGGDQAVAVAVALGRGVAIVVDASGASDGAGSSATGKGSAERDVTAVADGAT